MALTVLKFTGMIVVSFCSALVFTLILSPLNFGDGGFIFGAILPGLFVLADIHTKISQNSNNNSNEKKK